MKYCFILVLTALTFFQCTQECSEDFSGTYAGICTHQNDSYDGNLVFKNNLENLEQTDYLVSESLFKNCGGSGYVNISADCSEMLFEEPSIDYSDPCGNPGTWIGKLSVSGDKLEGTLTGVAGGEVVDCSCLFQKI